MGQAQQKYTDEQLEVAIRLHDDFEYYAEHALKIKPKDKNTPGISDGVIPFVFNTAQKYLKWRLDKQMRDIGKMRAFIVKGRQQGCSTFIEALFFHDTTTNYGIKTFIQTHSKKATKNLYRMAHRYLKHLPDDWRPHVSVSNTDELEFDELDSGYTVSTAGSAESGRSDTIDNLHGSEVAFWKSSLDHTTALLQAVPDVKGSRVLMESTANGMGGYFQKGYMSAERGENGDYIAIFIPWYWQEEYRKDVPKGFELTPEEIEYVELYDTYPEFDADGECTIVKRKIDKGQLAWRRAKIAELEGSVSKFDQEYPPTAQKAFQYTSVASHISAEAVVAAMKRPQYRSYGAICAGFDPSFLKDGDRKAFILRQGANVWGLEYPKLDTFRAKVSYCKDKLDNKRPYIDKFFIDSGGGGYDIFSELDEDGYCDDSRVVLVNSANAAENDKKYANRRAEMTDRIKKGLTNESMPWSISVDPELKDAFVTDLTAEGSTEDSANRILIEKKEKVKVRLGISADGKDALGLTVAERVIRKHVMADVSNDTSYMPRKRTEDW
jgi:hypothetical protein